ncbi:TPR-like protein [Phellopilus nigrolimitatus]|nr:TPR-like protein [Phellopilus nigrolimitatus]
MDNDTYLAIGRMLDRLPPGDPSRSGLDFLANALFTRFEQAGRMDDLEVSISLYRGALSLRPPGHPLRPLSLNELAHAVWTRFEQAGRMKDLEESIVLRRDALELCPHGHTHRSSSLNNLAVAVRTRFEQTGRMEDLEEAIVLHRNALELRPPGHPDRSSSFNNLAVAVSTRFEQTGRMEDLEEAIVLHRDALELRPPGHTLRSGSLSNLAGAVSTRFEQTGRMEDLEEAIVLHRDALELHRPGHTHRSSSLNNLAVAVLTRFEQTGRMEDLEEAIVLHRNALELRPPGHPDRSSSFNNLAVAVSTRFEQTGRMEDLEEAIVLHRDALELCPPGHTLRSGSLSNLAGAVSTRFEQTGRMEDLEEAIVLHRDALELRPPGHTLRSGSLSNLAGAVSTRFEQTGRMEDLEEAIVLHRDALELRPPGHTDRSSSFNNLAGAMSTRFEQTGRMEDLEEAIVLHRDALELCPPGHTLRSGSLSNLAGAVSTRFEQTGRMEDLEEAIVLHRDALELRPPGHPDRSSSFNNLANAVQTRFKQTSRMEDLEEAIVLHRDALELHPPGHSHRSASINNLANAVQTRFKQTSRMEDLEEAIVLHRDALELRPPGHPDRSSSLNNLAGAVRTRFEKSGRMEDLEESLRIYEEGAEHVFSNTLTRLEVAVRWAVLARSQRHVPTLKAYRVALSLLEKFLVITPTVQMQHKILLGKNGYPTLASDAASYAIEIGEVAQAVEMLEQGRALIWSQLRGFRTPIEQLREVNKGLADKFLTTSRELESLATSSESKPTTLDARHSATGASQKLVDEMYSRKRRLASRLEDVVSEIRATSGFEDFLRARRFSVLQEAAVEGPVIIISHSKYRSDALIVLHDRPPVSIELDSNFSLDSIDLFGDLKLALQKVQTEPNVCDAGIRDVLESLWNRVVSRVVEKLDELGIEKQTRIWWCPTSYLSALPFHAAGPIRVVDGIRQYLSDDYVSSYTPTLTALVNARESKPEIRRHDNERPRLLVVALPDKSLPSVEEEYRAIQENRDFVRCLVGEQATREAVIDKFRDHDWVHFACHGHLNHEQPFLHAFQLFGEDRLTLLDIIQSNLPNAEFAFLSACHSAGQGLDGAFGEVLHLSAAMQFSGFRSVIGTMWAMADIDGPFVTKRFYRHMFAKEDSPELGYKRSARALRETIQRLRKRQGITVERWVNLIHIGA